MILIVIQYSDINQSYLFLIQEACPELMRSHFLQTSVWVTNQTSHLPVKINSAVKTTGLCAIVGQRIVVSFCSNLSEVSECLWFSFDWFDRNVIDAFDNRAEVINEQPQMKSKVTLA